MLIGIMGKMGSGKTLTMTILANYLSQVNKVPLWANYGLINSKRIKTLKDLWSVDGGIVALDEIWLTMDSRMWKDNVAMTRWVNQTRKKKLIVMYTTQHIRQVELRVRNGTDILIYCERKKGIFELTFIDYQYRKIGNRLLISQPNKFYTWYDTFEVLEPLVMQEKKDFVKKDVSDRLPYNRNMWADNARQKWKKKWG